MQCWWVSSRSPLYCGYLLSPWQWHELGPKEEENWFGAIGTKVEGTGQCYARWLFPYTSFLPCSRWLPLCWSTVEMSSSEVDVKTLVPSKLFLKPFCVGISQMADSWWGAGQLRPLPPPYPCLPFSFILLSLIVSRHQELMVPVSRAATAL